MVESRSGFFYLANPHIQAIKVSRLAVDEI